jgi:hypothetical protein
MNSGLDFELDIVEVPITVGGTKYVLREASGDAACKYRNAMLNCTELGPDGKPSRMGNMADTEPLLVSLCLFRADNDKPVALEVVRSWPNRVVSKIYDKAKELSEIDQDDSLDGLLKQKEVLDRKIQVLMSEDPAKNEQSGTQAGSD